MKTLIIILLVAGLFVFSRYYRRLPKTMKGWLARIFAIIVVIGWVYLVLRIR